MLVSYEWLRELCDPPLPLDVLVDQLTLTGTKVEAVHKGDADGLVIEFEITSNRPDCLGVYGIAPRGARGHGRVRCSFGAVVPTTSAATGLSKRSTTSPPKRRPLSPFPTARAFDDAFTVSPPERLRVGAWLRLGCDPSTTSSASPTT